MYNGLVSRKQLRKILRYLIMALAVFIASQFIPECSINYTTSFVMATVAAVSFTIIDMYFPLIPQ